MLTDEQIKEIQEEYRYILDMSEDGAYATLLDCLTHIEQGIEQYPEELTKAGDFELRDNLQRCVNFMEVLNSRFQDGTYKWQN